MCLAPLTLKRPEGSTWFQQLKTKYETAYMQVPCGKCPQCLSSRSRGWTFRLMEEAKVSSSCNFITLTYDNDNVPMSELGIPTLEKMDFELFMKSLRHKSPEKIKYYACGEYGSETHRPHYHAIMFNLPREWSYPQNTTIQETWKRGNVRVDPGTELTFAYVTKYIMKGGLKVKNIIDDDSGEVHDDDRIPEYSRMSKGLGLSFLTPQMRKYLKTNLVGHVMYNGTPTPLPRYFRDKVFTEQQRFIIQQKQMEYLLSKPELSAKQTMDVYQDKLRKHTRTLTKRFKL